MEVFNLTLNQMLVMFMFMLAGYILKKGKFIPDKSSAAVSKILAFVLAPALTLSNQIKMCTPETFMNNSQLILYGLIIVLVAIGLSYILSAIFVKNKERTELKYQRQIYKYALTFGNWGYMGNYMILGIWGDEMLFKYTMFNFFLNVFTYVWGVYILIPKSEKRSALSSVKSGLLTPPIIALLAGVLLGLTGVSNYIPGFMLKAFENAGSCMGPMAMLLAGIVIGEYDFLELIRDKKVYLASLFRLIIIPAIFVSVLKLANVATEVVILTLIAYAAPMGMNTIVYPAAYGCDTKTGASMAMISHVLCVVTIPVMYYIFAVIL